MSQLKSTPNPSPQEKLAALLQDVPVPLRDFYRSAFIELWPRLHLTKAGIGPAGDAYNKPRPFCSAFRVKSRLWHEATGWSLVIELLDPRDHLVECVLSVEQLEGRPRDAVALLAKNGLRIFSGYDQRLVLDFIRQWPVRLFETEANRTGWTEDKSAFVLPSGRTLVRQGSSTTFRYTGDRSSEEIGDLETWKAGIATLCVGNPVLLFACSAAFSAPLLPFQKATGSRVYHLHGLSGEGKTILLKAALTIWPKRRAGIRTWRTTVNGLEGAAAESNHVLLGLDDLPETPPLEFDAGIYMLGNDGGKTRMVEKIKLGERLTWQFTGLSTGEVSSVVALKGIGKIRRGGQSVRMLDIRVSDRSGANAGSAYDNLHGHRSGRAFVASLDRACDQASGPAGAAFVEAVLARDPKEIEKQLRNAIEDQASELRSTLGVSDDDPAETEVRRVLDSFALVAVAGEWATMFGITGWEKGSAAAAVIDMVRRWLAERGGTRPVDQMEVIKATREYLERHGSRLLPLPAPKGGRDGSEIYGYRDDGYFYLLAQTFAQIDPGRNVEVSARLLEQAGYLERGGERNSLLYRVPKAGEGRPRAYRIKRALLDD